MRQSISAAIAATAFLLAGLAHSEVYHQGKVVRWTADTYAARERMACTYGPWRSETLDNGVTLLTRTKRCEKASSK